MEDLATLIDLGPILEHVLNVLFAVLSAVAIWGVKKIGDAVGLENDDKIRQYLIGAVERGVEYGKTKAEDALGDADWAKVDVKSELVAHAAGYILSKVPDAIKKFGLTEEDIRDLVLSKLGASNEDTAHNQASPKS